MGFFTALVGSCASTIFYLALYLWPENFSEGMTALGTFAAFVGLHVGLKRLLSNHTGHVFILFVAASLVTLDRTFTQPLPVFLAALVAAHFVLVIFVALTFEVDNSDADVPHAENECSDKDPKDEQ